MSYMKPCEECGILLGGYHPGWRRWPNLQRRWLCPVCERKGARRAATASRPNGKSTCGLAMCRTPLIH